ncbi:NAD-dependent succinate-semialdehyde dehydrogenase [Mucilaginibacter sp. X5P1]|uniref:NAD-dependent succinate-semialdehyde dehydrogenase n=1 Tax=Mucilaginibacter sp. X5P1 TaxID=2723088 RepID=UPI00160E9786|nr:NAD-dependent succinate-semialdehyde dehydrogenase [Mucilaginibacter sp. X5P1]MBB6137192.1 succinate-semialdehyde dehydrogenase/glutarate-semialdehyde dehydrogenase [Mucilaginibacter sp. X5P1]
MNVFKSIFPYNQQVIAEYPLMDDHTINAILTDSAKAFTHWSLQSYAYRAGILNNVAAILRKEKEELATIITNEMGKVLAEAKGEVEKCAVTCEYYAQNAEAFLADEIMEAGYYKSLVAYQPIGAVLAIMPWNFPFWQVFRFAAPTLMAGNTALLKHAPNVTGCSLAIERVFKEAGAPQGVFQSLIIDVPEVEKIIAADIVQAATLTGSERAGSSMAMLAGKHIKKSVLELGGSDALIVLADADIEKAATVAIQSRMQNAGQSCIASKRFIVEQKIQDEFVNQLQLQIQKLKQGDPFNTNITTGPMARIDLAQQLEKQMQNSIKSGATLQLGGEVDGANFTPSLLLNVKKGMATFDEEAFGPVASVITAADEQDAINIANQSNYGLGGSIWTKDVDKGIALARKVNSGAVFINSLVKSDPRLPFGGIKRSGYGRELGRHGILEFVNIKSIAADQ